MLDIRGRIIFKDKLEDAIEWSNQLKSEYGFEVTSMQSIWYGHQEKIFGTKEERAILIDFAKKCY